MASVFNAAEAIDMGIEKERKRRDFYGYAAERFKDKDMKGLFARLRDWEETHIKKFSEIRATLEESEASESYEGEFAAYAKAAVNDLLYKQVSAEWFSKNVREPLTAVEYGMGFERDSILFFNELLRYMTPHHKEKVEEMIGEEKKHLIYLSGMKKEMAAAEKPLSHEMNTQLAIMKEGMSILLDKISGPINERQTKILTTVKNSVDRLKTMIDSAWPGSKQ